MRKPEQTPEPSIEEILASIRKIIADDGGQGQAAPQRPMLAQTPPNVPQRQFPPQGRQVQTAGGRLAELAEPAEPAGDDEILELTEDFMLDEGLEDGGLNAADLNGISYGAEQRGAHGPTSDLASFTAASAGLETVLSNVVAEVQRLSASNQPGADPFGPPTIPDRPEPSPRSARPFLDALRAAGGDGANEQTAPRPEQIGAAANIAADSQAQRAASRPVWSARRLEGEGPRTRTEQPGQEKTVARVGSSTREQSVSARDSWAEGVQMPVPASGPAAPFLQPVSEDPQAEPPLSGSGLSPATEIEKEKTFVGDVLTRVFGASPKKAEEPRVNPPGRPLKAEDLAHSTIADFASDKLRAPGLADALHSDKPFMQAITNSLETALAHSEAVVGAPAPQDDFSEALLPLDSELAPFGIPQAQAHGVPVVQQRPAHNAPEPKFKKAQAELIAETPELPRGGADDVPAEARQQPSQLYPQANRNVAEASGNAMVAQDLTANLLRQAPTARSATLPSGIEEAVKELIKPLIVQWLNENLPRIVENAVREELAGPTVSRSLLDSGSRR